MYIYITLYIYIYILRHAPPPSISTMKETQTQRPFHSEDDDMCETQVPSSFLFLISGSGSLG